MITGKVSYLQIVSGKTALELTRKKSRTKANQLSLSLPDTRSLVAVDVSNVSRTMFADIMSDMAPVWLFDLRPSPRLDRLVGDRAQALYQFDKIGTNYVDVLGLVGTTSRTSLHRNPANWTPVLRSILNDSKKKYGPFIALFENNFELNNGLPYLTEAIEDTLRLRANVSIRT